MTLPPGEDRPRRNAGLDLLRGLAILLVVLHHVGLRIPLRQGILAEVLPTWLLNALIYNGTEAVFLFFVISGFLITRNSLDRWGSLRAVDLRGFYLRRAARILPTLLALLALLAVLHLARVPDFTIRRADQSLGRALLAALGLHLNWYEGVTGYLPGAWDVLWSLSIEELFYLAFPLAGLALRRTRWLVAALVPLALSLPATRAALAAQPIWQEKATLPGMAAIATGVLAALVARTPAFQRRSLVPGLLLAGSAGLAAVLAAEGLLWRWLGNGTMLLLTGSSACLVLAFDRQAQGPAPWRLPGTQGLQTLGRLSYEVYLTHMFVVFAVVRAFKATGGGLRWGFLWYLPAVAASGLLGWAVARAWSTPAERRLKQRFL